MRIKARGKICWTLDILERLPNGYHRLDMLIQSVEQSDYLIISPSDILTLRLDNAAPLPCNETNLVIRAAKLLQEFTGTSLGAAFSLEKHIPIGAGMGGGSADAAAALLGLNKLWNLHLSMDTLLSLGLKLGADIPFCLTGGLCRAGGTGEQLQSLPCPRQHWLCVIQPCGGLSTKEVFQAFHLEDVLVHPDNETAQRALESGKILPLAHSLANVLEEVSAKMRPAIRNAITELKNHGAVSALMTGSGSAVFGLFDTLRQAEAAEKALKYRYPVCFTTCTATSGCEFLEE